MLIHHVPLWGNSDKFVPCVDLWAPILENAKFDIALNGHTHRFRFHEADKVSNPFPVCVGGGPKESEATMIVLTKKGQSMHIRVWGTDGAELKALDI